MINKTKREKTIIVNILRISLLIFMLYMAYAYLKERATPPNIRAYKVCEAHKARAIKAKVMSITGYCLFFSNGYSSCFIPRHQFLQIKIGDSIYKPANTFDIYIFKQSNPDSVMFVGWDFDCNDHLKKNADTDL